MTDQELELINKLSGVVAGSAGHILDEYTYYFVVASVVWATVGAATVWGAFAVRRYTLRCCDGETDGAYIFGAWVAPAVLILIGAIMIAVNVSDMLTPRAMAIHQLLKDIRGG